MQATSPHGTISVGGLSGIIGSAVAASGVIDVVAVQRDLITICIYEMSPCQVELNGEELELFINDTYKLHMHRLGTSSSSQTMMHRVIVQF